MSIERWAPNVTGHTLAFAATAVLGTALLMAQGVRPGDDKTAPPKAQPKATAPDAKTAAPREPVDAKGSAPRRAGLGMQLDGQGEQGLRVTGIDGNGAAAQAGFRQNDRILSIDGRPFANPRQVNAYLAGQAGRRVPIVVERDGQRHTIQYTLPAAEGDSAWLGVYLEEGDANMKGARITHVYPAGPAARSGLQLGDIITQIDNQKIDDSTDLVATVQELKPQAQSQFTILRAEQPLKVAVLLGSRNSSFQRGHEANYRGQGDDDDSRGHSHGNDPYGNIPPYAMQLEHERRAAEQHERIENEIRALREEIAKLREELKRK